MIAFRDRMARGRTHTGWLDSRHTFSFGGYRDPLHMGFRALRVVNEDRVIPGGGFPSHSHKDMDILTYVLEGALEHKDSLGNGAVIRTGDVQRMSAGTGIVHSEFNASNDWPVHFLQMWIIPAALHLPPSYEQKTFPLDERRGRLRLVAAPDGRDGAVTVHADVRFIWRRSVRAIASRTRLHRSGDYGCKSPEASSHSTAPKCARATARRCRNRIRSRSKPTPTPRSRCSIWRRRYARERRRERSVAWRRRSSSFNCIKTTNSSCDNFAGGS